MNVDPPARGERPTFRGKFEFGRRDQWTIACLLLAAVLLLGARLGWMAFRGGGVRRFDELPQRAAPMQLDLNTVGWPELSNLPGIGELLAREIVAYRQVHGPFRTLDELTQVRGIGDQRLREIRDFLKIAGD